MIILFLTAGLSPDAALGAAVVVLKFEGADAEFAGAAYAAEAAVLLGLAAAIAEAGVDFATGAVLGAATFVGAAFFTSEGTTDDVGRAAFAGAAGRLDAFAAALAGSSALMASTS